MFVTRFGLTSHEGRDAPDASSKRRVGDVKASARADDRQAAAALLLCDPSSMQFTCRLPTRPRLAIMPSFIGRTGKVVSTLSGRCGAQPWTMQLGGKRTKRALRAQPLT
jgi:hypothetical protein